MISILIESLRKLHQNPTHQNVTQNPTPQTHPYAVGGGGIAVALALSLPDTEFKPTILSITYGVVLFSIIVQGLTVKPLVKKMVR